jgi:hypothetical protein
VLTGFLLLASLLYVLHVSYDTSALDELLARTRLALDQQTAQGINEVLGPADDPNYLFTRYTEVLQARGFKDLQQRVQDISFIPLMTSRTSLLEALTRLEAIGLQARNRLGMVSPPPGTPLSGLSGTPPTVPYPEVRRNSAGQPHLPADNSAYLGRSLFTDYLLPVELGGMLLLVAAVGAIAIAHRRSGTADTAVARGTTILERPALVPEAMPDAGSERLS